MDQQQFMDAWTKWATANKNSIIDNGAHLGAAKPVHQASISDTENDMTAYAMVNADTLEQAATIFENHSHLSLHAKNRIEVVEVKQLPV